MHKPTHRHMHIHIIENNFKALKSGSREPLRWVLSAVPGCQHGLPLCSFTDGAPDVKTLSVQLLSKPSNECDQMAFNQLFGE